jgi:hypothetical protein
MNARTIGYWITTSLFALAIAGSALADLVRAPAIVEGMNALGYPVYVATLLGVWKLLGVVALLAPRMPRLKEWAYAGFLFELTGAAFSHVSAGVGSPAMPLVLLALAMSSWALRPEARVLGTVLPASQRLATATA